MHDGDSATDIAAVDELRVLADSLRRVDAAVAAAYWDEPDALAGVVADARTELAVVGDVVSGDVLRDAIGSESASDSGSESVSDIGLDIAAAAASPEWLARADEQARGMALVQSAPALDDQAAANAVVAVALARAAVAEAVLAVALARSADVVGTRSAATRRLSILRVAPVSGVGMRILDEVRHVVFDSPRAILVRLVITLAISLSLVSVYHFSGWTKYDDVSQLSLYLFSAVVGSVVCTNALCFEAQRVRDGVAGGERIWRILVAKNLAMAMLITVAALPVIGFLTVANEGNPIAMIDQLVTMVFIWLGVGNVLSVLYPLRHEPISARLRDGTWKPFLFSFALSYGVGLTVNLMIFWRLWSRQKASTYLAGGEWAAFVLVLASALTSWILLTVLAVACSREPRIRRVLSREMIVYQKPVKTPTQKRHA